MLWQSCFRGFNEGELRLSSFKIPTNRLAIPFLVPEMTLQAGSQLHIFPNVTGNRKGGHCTIPLSYDIMCFTTWLQLAVESSEDLKQPITNYIGRPLQRGTKVFAEKSMSSSAIARRFNAHLKAIEQYTSETVHNTRRGKMIEATVAHQAPIEQGQSNAMILSKAIALRYIDTTRPTRAKACHASF